MLHGRVENSVLLLPPSFSFDTDQRRVELVELCLAPALSQSPLRKCSRSLSELRIDSATFLTAHDVEFKGPPRYRQQNDGRLRRIFLSDILEQSKIEEKEFGDKLL